MRFEGKVALVTGGGRDIGRSVSERLAREGAKVVINYRNDEAAAKETLAAIEAAGGTALLYRADVTQSAEVLGLVEATSAAFGDRIDVRDHLVQREQPEVRGAEEAVGHSGARQVDGLEARVRF